MRILHWNDGYYPRIGGTETLVRDLCHVQQAAGHLVTVVSRALPGCPAEDEIDNIPVWRRPVLEEDLIQQPALLSQQVKACAAYKRRFQPDVIHVHGSHMAGWLHLLTRDAASCPTVVSLHAPIRLPAPVLRRLLIEVDAVAAVSASMKQQFSPLLAGRTGPVRIIHNGLAFPAESPAPLRQPATALCLGRMVHEKGFDIALRALSQVPEIRLIVAGDGIGLPALQQLAKELNIADRVDFRGWVHPHAVPNLFNEVSVVLMPSRWEEPFGLVALQAAQMGRPIIASRIGGLPEIIRHGETGLLVPPEDPSALADALLTLSDGPRIAATMGAAARLHAANGFSIERCASLYQELYALAATTGGVR